MILRRVNKIFAWGYFAVGATRVVILFIALAQVISAFNAVFDGRSLAMMSFDGISLVLSICQIILFIGSIVMVILNSKKQPEVIKGYLMGIGAFVLHFIFSAFILLIFISAFSFVMYIRAGQMINKNNAKGENLLRTNRSDSDLDDYFKNKANEEKDEKEKVQEITQDKTNVIDYKTEKKIQKIDKEIQEWKSLFDSQQIDEELYNLELNRLNEKKNKVLNK